ncbi:hypothetical protein GCM10017688_32070 [Streptomyces ramulosus]
MRPLGPVLGREPLLRPVGLHPAGERGGAPPGAVGPRVVAPGGAGGCGARRGCGTVGKPSGREPGGAGSGGAVVRVGRVVVVPVMRSPPFCRARSVTGQ